MERWGCVAKHAAPLDRALPCLQAHNTIEAKTALSSKTVLQGRFYDYDFTELAMCLIPIIGVVA